MWVALWGAGKRGLVDSGLQLVCTVHAFVVFHVLPSLAFLPPLSGLASVCFEDRKYTQHSLGGGRKAKKKGGVPKAGVNTGGQRE